MKEEEAFLKTLLADLAEGSEQIEMKNQELNEEIKNRTKELIVKSEELARYTQQLEGFAYVTAHNIRGPIARLKGLANIFDPKELSQKNAQVWGMFTKNVEEVDEIVKDLGDMLEVRSNIHEMEETVDLESSIKYTEQILQGPILENSAIIYKDLQATSLTTIKPYFENIVYQLLSNSIKFRNPNEQLEIWIKTKVEGENLILSVIDNGLGLDLEQHQEQLFQMYKRFHLHAPGKGLGLHLTKIQVENLHGKIELYSQPMQGMEVRLILPLDPGIVVH